MTFRLGLTVLLLVAIAAGGKKSYYDLLGVRRSASEREIKKAFHQQSMKWHPDKNPDNPEEAQKKFVKISHAYDVLTDPAQRRIYDQVGEEGINNPGGVGKRQQRPQQQQQQRSYSRTWSYQSHGRTRPPPPPPKPDDEYFQRTNIKRLYSYAQIRTEASKDTPLIIIFYGPECRHCTDNVPLLCRFADDARQWGIRFAAVSCAGSTKELCTIQGIKMLPTFKFFAPGKTSTIHLFKGNFEREHFGKWIMQMVQQVTSTVQVLRRGGMLEKKTPEWHVKLKEIHAIKSSFGLQKWSRTTYTSKEHIAHIVYLIPDGGDPTPRLAQLLALKYRNKEISLTTIPVSVLDDYDGSVPAPSLINACSHSAAVHVNDLLRGNVYRLPRAENFPKHHISAGILQWIDSQIDLVGLYQNNRRVKEWIGDDPTPPPKTLVILFYGVPSWAGEVRLLDLIGRHLDNNLLNFKWLNVTQWPDAVQSYIGSETCRGSSYYACPRLLAFDRGQKFVGKMTGMEMMEADVLRAFVESTLKGRDPEQEKEYMMQQREKIKKQEERDRKRARAEREEEQRIAEEEDQLLEEKRIAIQKQMDEERLVEQAYQKQFIRQTREWNEYKERLRKENKEHVKAQQKKKEHCDPNKPWPGAALKPNCCYGDDPFPSLVHKKSCNSSSFYLYSSRKINVASPDRCEWSEEYGCLFNSKDREEL